MPTATPQFYFNLFTRYGEAAKKHVRSLEDLLKQHAHISAKIHLLHRYLEEDVLPKTLSFCLQTPGPRSSRAVSKFKGEYLKSCIAE